MKRSCSFAFLIVLTSSMLVSAFHIQLVKASGTTYIRADGSIDPPTAPITTFDNVTYTLTGNITVDRFATGIVVQRNDIIIDGEGYTLQGAMGINTIGVDLSERTNVTVRNAQIGNMQYGIQLHSSSSNSISENNITRSSSGIHLSSSSSNIISSNNLASNGEGVMLVSSSNNIVSGNNITSSTFCGIRLYYSSDYNCISENNITSNNELGIELFSSSGNSFSRNNITNNGKGILLDSSSNNSIGGNDIANNSNGVWLYYSSSNSFYHNNFKGNTQQVHIEISGYPNVWDDGYPSGGNYWSDYLAQYPTPKEIDSSGIGDTPYVLDTNNQDCYPLMTPWPQPVSHLWPMFRHDPTHTGYSTSTTPNTNQTPWNFRTANYVTSSPAIVDGKVFVGSGDYNVYALNATTGTKVWNYTTNGEVNWASPAVAGGVVYVGSNDYNVYALDATTGTKVWNYTTGDAVFSSPAVVGGVVYEGSFDGKVYALNATTGTQVWNYTTSSQVWSSPAVAGGVVYVGSNDYNVYALDATTGTKVWNYTTGDAVYSSPAVDGGMIFVGSCDNKTYALNALTGAFIWSFKTNSYVYSSPAVSDGKVYVGSGNMGGGFGNGAIYCLDASSGALIWNYTTGGWVDSSPAVAAGIVYVGSSDHNVYGLNSTTGTLVWSFRAGDWVFSSPAVVDGVVYVGSLDGHIYAGRSIDVYQFDSNEPAAMGIGDYGIGPSGPYEYATKSFVGTVTIASLLTNTGSSHGASFQLNVEFEFNTIYGSRVYWIQNVMAIDTSSRFVTFVNNVWNWSDFSANMSASCISGKGQVSTLGSPTNYYYVASPSFPGNDIALTYPTTITLNVTSGVSSCGEPTVSFAYDDGYGLITYDMVTFTNVTGLASITGFKVTGFSFNPRGQFYNADLILGGPGGGGTTTNVLSDVQLQLKYWNGHNYQIVPNAYNFGSNTGELISNVLCEFSHYPGNGTLFARMLPGAGQLGKLYDQSQTGVINVTSSLASGTLSITDTSDSNASAWKIPFVSGEVAVTLYPGCYYLQLYDQHGELYDQGNFTVNAGQILYLQAPFSSPVRAYQGRIVLFQGFTANITITVANHSPYPETVNVTVYVNMTATANVTKIDSLVNVPLDASTILDLTCGWNTTGFEKRNATTQHGNYTLLACVDSISSETNLEENNFTGGAMLVSMIGDLNGGGPTIWVFVPDGKCNILDVSVVAKCFGSYPTCPPPQIWNANCDVTGLIAGVPDGKVNILDVVLVARHFGEPHP